MYLYTESDPCERYPEFEAVAYLDENWEQTTPSEAFYKAVYQVDRSRGIVTRTVKNHYGEHALYPQRIPGVPAELEEMIHTTSDLLKEPENETAKVMWAQIIRGRLGEKILRHYRDRNPDCEEDSGMEDEAWRLRSLQITKTN